MPGNSNRTTCVDPTSMARAEAVLDQSGMPMQDAFTIPPKETVRAKSVPLPLTSDSSSTLYMDLLEAQTARISGVQYRNARDVVNDMRTAIKEIEAGE